MAREARLRGVSNERFLRVATGPASSPATGGCDTTRRSPGQGKADEIHIKTLRAQGRSTAGPRMRAHEFPVLQSHVVRADWLARDRTRSLKMAACCNATAC